MSDEEPAPQETDQGRGRLGGAAVDIAASAAVGAARGGAAGAALGAGKAVAGRIARNPKARAWVLGLLALPVVAAIMVAVLFTQLVGVAASVLGNQQDQNSLYVASVDADPGLLADAQDLSRAYKIPWQIILAALQEDDNFDANALRLRLNVEDPDMRYRQLAQGAQGSSTTIELTLPEDEDTKAHQDKVREVYMAALTHEDVGFDERTADRVFTKALAWALSAASECEPQEAVPAADGSKITVGGVEYTPAQVDNMKRIIGVAKTMFGADAEKAAIVGLITAKVEGGFRNYANDGKVTSQDFNMGGFTAADYALLAYSLELPHDAVGSDHASLGIMQQQATMGWGDYGSSTWRSDPRGVIERLMTPEFATGKFFVRLAGVAGWQDMEPGVAAQTVQVSAYPDRYAAHVAHAKDIWATYGASPALDVPVETGWTGGTGTVPGGTGEVPAGNGCVGGGVVEGGWAWPVETDETGMMVGRVSSTYGWRIHPAGYRDFHEGTDFTGAGLNSPVRAAGDGKVVRSATWGNPACGEYIEILHPDGTATGYLHLNTRDVEVGDTVSGGQKIGDMGGTQPGGCSFGAHLHMYAYDVAGKWMNPEIWLRERGLIIPQDRFPGGVTGFYPGQDYAV